MRIDRVTLIGQSRNGMATLYKSKGKPPCCTYSDEGIPLECELSVTKRDCENSNFFIEERKAEIIFREDPFCGMTFIINDFGYKSGSPKLITCTLEPAFKPKNLITIIDSNESTNNPQIA